jgi:hypothetical protein
MLVDCLLFFELGLLRGLLRTFFLVKVAICREMLSDLFQDDDDTTPEGYQLSSYGSQMVRPPPPRSAYGFVGLENQLSSLSIFLIFLYSDICLLEAQLVTLIHYYKQCT